MGANAAPVVLSVLMVLSGCISGTGPAGDATRSELLGSVELATPPPPLVLEACRGFLFEWPVPVERLTPLVPSPFKVKPLVERQTQERLPADPVGLLNLEVIACGEKGAVAYLAILGTDLVSPAGMDADTGRSLYVFDLYAGGEALDYYAFFGHPLENASGDVALTSAAGEWNRAVTTIASGGREIFRSEGANGAAPEEFNPQRHYFRLERDTVYQFDGGWRTHLTEGYGTVTYAPDSTFAGVLPHEATPVDYHLLNPAAFQGAMRLREAPA
ncbi:MAG: hypothetical protein HY556_01320 [Euryarchaeota archaeon]|nr:hypothetical protein [Euryarchaeota archaeon]